jgi:hypothetical protein
MINHDSLIRGVVPGHTMKYVTAASRIGLHCDSVTNIAAYMLPDGLPYIKVAQKYITTEN